MAGSNRKVRLEPAEVAETLSNEQTSECQYRLWNGPEKGEWLRARTVLEPGAIFAYLAGVQDDIQIQLRLCDNGKCCWQSKVMTQFFSVRLEKVIT